MFAIREQTRIDSRPSFRLDGSNSATATGRLMARLLALVIGRSPLRRLAVSR
jgi:hypothetical protein